MGMGRKGLGSGLTDTAPVFALSQLCPVIEAAFNDMYANLLHLVTGKCPVPSCRAHLQALPPFGRVSHPSTCPLRPEQRLGGPC